MGLLFSNSYVPKNLYLPILLHFFHLIFSLPQPRFHKPYLQSKTFLNIRAVLGIAVFSSNAVLMIGPSFSMQFFGFFDMLPSSPTITRMTLMLLMFHILLIYLFSSWYISIFSFYFLLTHVSRYSNITYGTTSLINTHYNNFWFLYLDISVRLDHNIPLNFYFFIFNNTFWSMFVPLFTSFQVVFPTQFPMNYSCRIMLSLVLCLCQLFTFAHNIKYCFTFLVTHSTKC